jgi:hypothetical protein
MYFGTDRQADANTAVHPSRVPGGCGQIPMSALSSAHRPGGSENKSTFHERVTLFPARDGKKHMAWLGKP